VLVADDDPNDAFLLSRSLINAGIGARMNFVRDGQEAIDYLAGSNGFSDRTAHPFPEVLLLDLNMPRLNGYDVLKRVNKDPALRPKCIVVLTSSTSPDEQKRVEKLGVDLFLTKPKNDFHKMMSDLLAFWNKHSCFQ
jgi:CheY-like chemotaxis protein